MPTLLTRRRITIANVGTAYVEGPITGMPPNFVIRNVAVTLAVAVDTDASLGTTAATDIGVQVREASGISAYLGGNAGAAGSGGVVLSYPLSSTAPSTTVNSEESRPAHLPAGASTLYVAVQTDVQTGGVPDATAVVVIDFEYEV